MVECTKKIAKLNLELTMEERNLLSVGYKNVISARHASWRIMSSIEQKEESKGNEQNVKLIKNYRSKVEEDAASNTASTNLSPTHPIRLGLALNFSVFYYEILNSPERVGGFSLVILPLDIEMNFSLQLLAVSPLVLDALMLLSLCVYVYNSISLCRSSTYVPGFDIVSTIGSVSCFFKL
ncbi:hypothetical protein IFM89_002984 [Coptis chinensis]|uniref:14-3-3 domain-containing protein n=1 Tax=Coptis chinensis TaxID=261450 RepID=A0A835LWS5_9MAGN|nr:hypothetical protein IFM89_002984 [Coptis chinensis]